MNSGRLHRVRAYATVPARVSTHAFSDGINVIRFAAFCLTAALGLLGTAQAATSVPPAAATSTAATGKPLPIVIGWQTDTDWLTIEAANLHLFRKAGLNAKFIRFTAGAPMMAAAESKSVDVTTPGFVPFLSGVAQGIPWVAIGINTDVQRAEGFVARKGSGIHSFADLKGKRIGFYRASTSQYGLYVALKHAHIPLDQVKLLSLLPSAQLAAMRNGEIDAAEVWEPWMRKMVAQAHGYIFATEADLGIKTGAGVYAARRDWLKAHPETAERFMTAIVMAGHALEKNPQPAIKAFAIHAGIPDAWSAAIYKESQSPWPWRWLDPSYGMSMVKGGGVAHAMRDLAAFLYQQHIVATKITNIDALFDRSVIATALKARQNGGAAVGDKAVTR